MDLLFIWRIGLGVGVVKVKVGIKMKEVFVCYGIGDSVGAGRLVYIENNWREWIKIWGDGNIFSIVLIKLRFLGLRSGDFFGYEDFNLCF